ncbi:MAG: AAA family ATPase [Candidatus Bathyarchaeia archaeon]
MVIDEVQKVIVGKRDVLENILIALLSDGHVILEGVPGIAKTMMAKNVARTLGCEFRRIQFTPDLLPADIVGTYVYEPNKGSFYLRKGPIFANIVLADEINRAPPKTQSALLECMQEKQVTIEGNTLLLPGPFMVLATQNPIELAGTYPLPEAQIDRFIFRLILGYPTEEEEVTILNRMDRYDEPVADEVTDQETIVSMQRAISKVHVDQNIIHYIKDLIFQTREDNRILLGGSPRASVVLLRASKARAAIQGRDFVLPDDVKALVDPVLNHRLILRPEVELAGTDVHKVIVDILSEVKVPD